MSRNQTDSCSVRRTVLVSESWLCSSARNGGALAAVNTQLKRYRGAGQLAEQRTSRGDPLTTPRTTCLPWFSQAECSFPDSWVAGGNAQKGMFATVDDSCVTGRSGNCIKVVSSPVCGTCVVDSAWSCQLTDKVSAAPAAMLLCNLSGSAPLTADEHADRVCNRLPDRAGRSIRRRCDRLRFTRLGFDPRGS